MRTTRDELRVGVVGAGYFARFHLDAWQRIPGATLTALCDRDEARLAEAGAALRGVSLHTDVEALLDENDLDLVDVATPPESHAALVAAAARRGLDVVCQKPLAPSYAEAVAIVERAEDAGVRLIVHENIRWAPWHREMGRFVRAGKLGTPHGVSMRLRPGDGQGERAYLDRQPYFQRMPRLLVHETAIHWIDTFRFLMGEVSGVCARLRRLNPVIAGEDAGLVIFAFESGAAGLFDGNRLNDHVSDNPRRTMGETWLEGSAGVLRLDGAARLWWKPHGEPEREHPYTWQDRGFSGDAVHATQSHVVAHLREGAPLENGGRAYLRNLEIEEAIYRSHEERRWIDLPAPGA